MSPYGTAVVGTARGLRHYEGGRSAFNALVEDWGFFPRVDLLDHADRRRDMMEAIEASERLIFVGSQPPVLDDMLEVADMRGTLPRDLVYISDGDRAVERVIDHLSEWGHIAWPEFSDA